MLKRPVTYYEEIQSGLGKRFAIQLQYASNAIKRNPFFASVRYDNISLRFSKKIPLFGSLSC
jgi:hypothetical protein